MPTNIDAHPKYVTKSLQTANEALAIELLNGPTMNSIVGFMPRIFKSARDGLAVFLTAKFDYFKAKSYEHDQLAILQKFDDVGYGKIATLPLATLEGFVGNYAEYGKQMLVNLTFFDSYTQADLARYKLLLGDIISNRSARLDLTDLTKRYRATEKARAESDKANADFFAAGSHLAIQPLGNVVASLNDLKVIFSDSQLIISRIKAIDPEAVKNRVNEINDLVDLLVGELDAKNVTELSKAQIQNLSQGIMELAYQIEHFSLSYYRAVTYVTAVGRLTDALNKA